MMGGMRPAFLTVIFLAAAPARAYQRDEHYYSLRLALGENAPRLAGDEIVAMCGQLADEAPELNPIATYRRVMRHPLSYASWSLTDGGPDATVGAMVTVQQLLHGLTGGSSEAAHEIALDTARGSLGTARKAPAGSAARADALCALGFALHFYGDSYAHRRIHNPARMYPTGLGHMFDAGTPDIPFYTPARTALWLEYLRSLKVLFPELSAEAMAQFLDQCKQCIVHAKEENAYGARDLHRLEALELERLGVVAAPLPRAGRKFGCQRLVDLQMKGAAIAPDCERSWSLYRGEAERAFAAYDADASHANSPSRDLRRVFYGGPLFERVK
jgi:hypothetical protein